MKRLNSIFFAFYLFTFNSLISNEIEQTEKGTLIVTYQTDNKGERLNRIRFWLKREDNLRQTLYPKGKSIIDDSTELTRKVVIDDLSPGNYTVEFLIPNTDHYFQEIPPRKVVVAAGEVVKVDQRIKTRQNIAEVSPVIEQQKPQPTPAPSRPEPLVEEKSVPEKGFGKLIVSFDMASAGIDPLQVHFRLIDSEGQKDVYPRKGKDTEVPLKNGRIIMVQNLPEGNYTVEFFIPSFENGRTIATQSIHLDANKTKSVQQTITCEGCVEAK